MPKRVSSLLFAAIFLLAAAACLSPAARSLSEISRPHDLFGLSLLASSLLIALFVVAFVGSILLAQDGPSTHHARMWLWNLAIALTILAISLAVITTETPTSFVSWDQVRGSPLAWLENGHFYGPCLRLGRARRTYWPTSLRPLAVLIDLGLIIAAVHFVRRLTTRSSRPGQPGVEPGAR
jgi:MFS family permease